MRPAVLAVTILAALLTPAGGSAATLVFSDGSTIEVKTLELAGASVFVTLPNGARMAYEVADVNLVASGLVTADDSTGDKKADDDRGRSTLTDGISTGPEPTFVIDDDDVDHIFEPEPDAELPPPADLNVRIERVNHSFDGTNVTVLGSLQNFEKAALEKIQLRFTASGDDEETKPITSIHLLDRTLQPNEKARFNFTFQAEGQITKVAAELHAAKKVTSPQEAPKPKQTTNPVT
jgi:hypothetical protein